MTDWLLDLRGSVRKLARSPGFTTAVVLSLALGIGANGAIFSVVRGVLLRPLPYGAPDRLVRVFHGERGQGIGQGSFSPQDFDDLRRAVATPGGPFETLAAYWFVPGLSGVNLAADGGEPLRLQASYVSGGFFPALGVPAAVGRTFAPEEDAEGRDHVAVLSDGLWHRRFGADAGVVGRTLSLDGQAFTVVGVMPPDFTFPSPGSDLWMPISLIGETSIPHRRALRWMEVAGRLAPGVSPAAAQEATEAVLGRLAAAYPESNRGWTQAAVVPLRDTLVGDARPALLILFGAVALVLLIACANLANLFLVRALGRRREVAVRAVLGASRSRLARQMLAESVLVAVAGGLVGLLVASWGQRLLLALGGGAIPRPEAVRLDGAVVAFTLALAVATGLAFGLLPALRGAELGSSLEEGSARGGSRREGRVSAVLVMAETALAVVLLVGSLLLVESFWHVVHHDPGFRAAGVLTVSLTTPADRYPSRASRETYRRRVIERLAALPGVLAVGGSKTLPLHGGGEPMSFTVPGREGPEALVQPESGVFIVTPGYFRALGIPLLAGRGFTWDDGTGGEPPGVIVSRRLARQVWGREDVVGESLAAGETEVPVIGVVDDVRTDGLVTPPGSAAYVPSVAASRSTMKLFVRAAGDPMSLAEPVRQAIWQIDPDQPIAGLASLRQVVAEEAARPRLLGALVGGFAALATLLAAVGLYGVLAYGVRRRTRELGIRVALGADRRALVGAVLIRSLAFAGAGLAGGFLISWSLARQLASQLYQVRPLDPGTYGAVALGVLAVTLLAGGLPARRAARIDPMRALREE